MLLLSMISFAQTEEKKLNADIRGRDCYGGSGLCSVIIPELAKSDIKNIKIIKQQEGTILLQFEINELSLEEQIAHFGKELTKMSSTEKSVFFQNDDFVFDRAMLIYLEIDPKYNLLKKGNYPVQISFDKLEVVMKLSTQ